ncbi:MAG TPA: nitronate monooxygenase family protein [Thermohalobaculum sp.]|nr:nitronate monooxygenase family protein [Thermohalobaculum sp.]
MWPDRRLCDLLGIEHPIVQAPMAGSDSPALAAAVANAGGLGSIGCAMMAPDAVRAAYAAARGATNGALNLNFFAHRRPEVDGQKAARAKALMMPFYMELGLATRPDDVPDVVESSLPFGEPAFEALMELRPLVASFHFGLPEARFVEALKAAGTVILCTATTPAEARDLEARGVDAIVAQGWEAGGHHGYYLGGRSARMGTMALVPQVADAVSIPVIAAGGIADGRGIAAALALGAAGVQIGTAFLTTRESGAPAPHRAALMASDGSDTRPTRAFSGRPARGVINRYMEMMERHEAELPDFPLMNTVTGPLRRASAEAGLPDFVALWSGQGVGLNRELPAAELVERLVEETRAAIGRLGG